MSSNDYAAANGETVLSKLELHVFYADLHSPLQRKIPFLIDTALRKINPDP